MKTYGHPGKAAAVLLAVLAAAACLTGCGADSAQWEKEKAALELQVAELTEERDSLLNELHEMKKAAYAEPEEEYSESLAADAAEEPPVLPEAEIFGGMLLFGMQTDVYADGEELLVPAGAVTEALGERPGLEVREYLQGQFVTLSALSGMDDVVLGTDPDGNSYAARDPGPIAVSQDNRNVPILMYHAVSDDLWGYRDLFVSPSSMEEQLAYLTENGYETIWFEDLNHLEDFEKPVILTFDDGYEDNYTELFPLLQKYGAKATVFLIGKDMGTGRKMTEAQILEMVQSGLVSMQSHTYSHGFLTSLTEEELRAEMENSRSRISAVTGVVPRVLCYPTGYYNPLVSRITAEYYSLGIKADGGVYVTGSDPMRVPRFYITRACQINEFSQDVSFAER